MSSKFLRFLLAVPICMWLNLGCATDRLSPFKNPFLGKCFQDTTTALKAIGGIDADQDENFLVKESSVPAGGQWIIDKTSEHNYQWHLIEPSRQGNLKCVSLYIPFASEVSGQLRSGIATIEAKTQASPGFREITMIFRKSAKLGYYVPVSCHKAETDALGRKSPKTEVNCLSVAD